MRNTNRVFESRGYTITTPPANVPDRSRYANNAVLSGGAAWKKVNDQYVLDFTSATAKATIAKNASINNMSQFTFRCWFYYAGTAANYGVVFGKVSKLFYIGRATNNLSFNHIFSGSTGAWYTPANGIDVGKWHCIQITYDNTNVANNPVIMLNGVSVAITASAPTGTASEDSANDLMLGNNTGASRFLNGYLSHVELRQGIATVAEGKRWYNATCLNFGLPQIP